MTEDRRVTAPDDGDAEAAAPEDEITEVPPPVEPMPEKVVPRDRPSERRPSGDTASARRVRARMTLRIPDDEVSRPTPRAMPAADIVDDGEPPPPIQGTRIISVGPPPFDDSDDAAPLALGPPSARVEREDSWTPYQPTVAEAPPTPRDLDPDATTEYLRPISEEIAVVDGMDGGDGEGMGGHYPAETMLDLPTGPSSAPAGPVVRPPSYKPASASSPPLPRSNPPSEPLPPARAPMRAMLHTDPEGEEVRFEEEESTPVALYEPKPRPSEPGDAPEISVDDLMSVESLPKAAPPPPGVPPMRPKAKSIPPPTSSPPPAAGKPPLPPAVAQTPATPPASVVSPSSPSPPAAQVSAPFAAAPTPATAQGSARTDGRARVVTPQSSGALAPPPLTDAAASRKRVRPWWEELFNDDFIRASSKVTDSQIGEETSFIEESLGVARDGVLLDLGCGTGLHAIELTRRGYHVVGFDLSLAMLARAADEAHDREARLNFVQGDMRDMTFDEQFDGVYCWGTSFGYFDEEKNAQVISRVHKALRPGGVFLLDVVNRDYIMKQSPSLAWFEGEGCICMDEMQIDWITSRMKVKRTMMMDDGRTKEIEYSIRVYALHELGRVLHEQGFRVAEVSGRTATPGVFFGCDSPRTLILAAKR
jgi:SAM-dependent methyltransferase